MWQDARIAFRTLIKNFGVTFVAILILAAGLATTITVFSILRAVLLSALPYKHSDRVVEIWDHPVQNLVFPHEEYNVWNKRFPVFDSVGAYKPFLAYVGGKGTISVRVSANLLSLFGRDPFLGRHILPEDEAPGAPPVTLISYHFWQTYFSSDPTILGQTITINDLRHTVIGVLPKDLRLPRTIVGKVWVPIRSSTSSEPYWVVGRLKTDIGMDEVYAVMRVFEKRIRNERSFPYEITINPVNRALDRKRNFVRNTYMIGQASTTILLLISCSNIAGLMLARGLARRKDMAIRTAVGASRALLIRQILIESILTSSIAGILSLFFASWMLHAGRRLIPYNLLVTIDPNQIVLGKGDILFGFLISVVSAFLFGILPALQVSKLNLNEILKEGSQQDSSRFKIIKSREAVTCIQIALALVLLISGGLVFRSISNVLAVNPGFRTDDISTTEIILPDFRYHDDDRIIQFERALLHEARDVFGVHHAAITSNLPLQGTFQSVTAEIEGQRIADVSYRLTSKDYPSTFGIPLLKGHYFSDSEKEPVAIINESFAKRFFKQQDIVGRFIKCGQMSTRASISRRIIGIIRDTKSQGLDVPSEPEIYVPFYQDTSAVMTLIVRSKLGKKTVTQKIQNVISGIDKTQPFQDVISMRQVLADSESQRKFITSILSASAIIAFVLSLVGIYGTISYYTQQRQQEIAIRRAVGATEKAITRIVLIKAARIITVGVLLGLAVSLPSTRLLANWLFNVNPADLWTFVGACGLLVMTALLAAYFPARRAARLDPMKALRYE